MELKPSALGYIVARHFSLCAIAFILVAAGAAMLAASGEVQISLLPILGGIMILLACLAHAQIHRHVTSLRMGEEEVEYETGVLSHYKKKLPIRMVTDTSVTRSILERVFGIATLNIGTSGSPGYEIVAEALNYPEAERFHSALYSLMGKEHKPKRGVG